MSKPGIHSTPDENRIEELLGKVQPLPSESFHQKMKQAAWQTKNFGSQARRVGKLRIRVTLAAIVVLLIASLLATPQGRAWAQEVFQFFDRINSQTVELPESSVKLIQEPIQPHDLPLVPVILPTVPPEMAVLPDCETPQRSQSYDCQVALAESQAGFNLKELPALPQGWKFNALSFNAASKSVTISYFFDFRDPSYGTLYLQQGKGTSPKFNQNDPWDLVPADKIEKVKVGSYDGEFVEGLFGLPANSSKLEWSEVDHNKRLAWSDGTNWFLMEVWPNLNLPDTMSRDRLIELAESLVDSPAEQVEALDPDFLYSISEAEQVSGFDLKAPTLLPIEVSFSHARYSLENSEVTLFYGNNDELVIHQHQGESPDLDTLPKSYDPNLHQELVKVHGKNAIYGSAEGPEPYLFLRWEADGLYYELYHYAVIGGTLDKEKMIAVAESMQDLDDFRKRGHPYEYVSIYAQALGFDAREFRVTPTVWSYANVWANPPDRCIFLFYTSTTEQGALYISQCLTDKHSDISGIPAQAIEPVQVGNQPGQYIVGRFVTDDNGNTVWDSASPAKQLYWQEDGLWMQISLSGNSASRYDRKALISIAESLH